MQTSAPVVHLCPPVSEFSLCVLVEVSCEYLMARSFQRTNLPNHCGSRHPASYRRIRNFSTRSPQVWREHWCAMSAAHAKRNRQRAGCDSPKCAHYSRQYRPQHWLCNNSPHPPNMQALDCAHTTHLTLRRKNDDVKIENPEAG